MPKLFSPRTESGWLSVVLRQRRADFVHIRPNPGGKPAVLLADSVEMVTDATTTLSSLRRPLRLDRYRCTVLLRHGDYQLIQTEEIPGKLDEAKEAMRWKLKDQVDFPIEDAAIDLLPIPAEGRAGQVFVAVAPAAIVAPLVQAFQAARLGLAAIDLPELSQRNLAGLFEEEGRGLATLVFDDDEGLLTFTRGRELLVVRHVEISAGQLAAADADRRNQLLERVTLDVQRSLDNFDRIYSSVPLAHLLVAPIPGVDELLPMLRENLTVSITVLEIGKVLDLAEVPGLIDPLRQFQSLRAIGAALRDEFATS